MNKLSYLAGAIDSDGYISVKRSTYAMRIRGDARNPIYSERMGLKQVTPYIPKLLQRTFGGYLKLEVPSATHGKPLWSWSCHSLQCSQVLKQLLPYLKVKKRQARLCLLLRKSIDAPRHVTRRYRKQVGVQRNRWGMYKIRRMELKPSVISYRERLRQKVFQLNDHRTDSRHQPLPDHIKNTL